MAGAARQLGHSNANILRNVFSKLDLDCDGVLDLRELRAGFVAVYGEDSREVNEVEGLFNKLDLDGTGRLSYTEFCTAGMDKDMRMQEQVLWSAFKSFDVAQDTDVISADKIERLLSNADKNESMSKADCENVARQVIQAYDKNGDGNIDFHEFRRMLVCSAGVTTCDAYDLLQSLDNSPKRKAPGSGAAGTWRSQLYSWAMQLVQACAPDSRSEVLVR